jgi:Xaa-Pro aminopeptidase
MTINLNPSDKEKAHELRSHDIPISEGLIDFMMKGWVPLIHPTVNPHSSIQYTKLRREKLSKKYPGVRLIFPAGVLKVRSNDTYYPFRAHTDFAWFTGITSTDCVPDSIFVMEPNALGHDDLLFTHPRSSRDSDEFYKDTKYGEFWVGKKMSLSDTQNKYQLKVMPLESISQFLFENKESIIIRGVDQKFDKLITQRYEEEANLLNTTSMMRMVKDQYEIDQMQVAVDATVRGFADMVRAFPAATATPRGERVIESAFYGRARIEGNDNGYSPIVAAGSHACVLHWVKNDGEVLPGDLILIDAGVEVDSFYTADITRTFPVNGKFTKAQRDIYMIVYRAQSAGIAAVRAGAKFKDIHAACMEEIAKGAFKLGVLPVSIEESLKPEVGLHRRWQFHGSGHHLGIDVHDCAHARKEEYAEGLLEPGMILTVEPGFYIQPDDSLFAPEYRGIGVRIEDDILVTQSGAKILSNALPRHPDEVEVYMAKLLH